MSIWWTTPTRRGAIWSRAPSIWTAKTELGTSGARAANSPRLDGWRLSGAQGLDARQNLALHPFQEGAAGGGDEGHVVGRARVVQGRDGVAAAGHGDQLAGLGQFSGVLGGFDRGLVEGRDLEQIGRASCRERV